MKYTLFLDDIREPDWWLRNAFPEQESMEVARNNREAKAYVRIYGLPNIISFDHDLGTGEDDAMDFMWWLIDNHIDGKLNLEIIDEIIIHSANPVGAQNLQGLWDGFAKNELDSGTIAQLRPATR